MSRIVVLLACLLAASSSSAAKETVDWPEASGLDGQSGESVEFQAVNSYLTDMEPLTDEPSQVVGRLSEAVDAIESLGAPTFEQLGADHSIGKLGSLLHTDAQVTLTVLRKLIWASRRCDQESLDFLVLVVEHET